MYVVLGGTGHIGSALVERLLTRGEAVTLVTRSSSKARAWAERGATLAELDVRDVAALRRVLSRGRRAYLLNPPADPSGDPVEEEHATARAIVAALDGSGLEAVVAASTYGAQPAPPGGEGLGDLGVLYAFEEALKASPSPPRSCAARTISATGTSRWRPRAPRADSTRCCPRTSSCPWWRLATSARTRRSC